MPDIGIFGGSGFYELLDDATEHRVDTPYGEPSDPVVTGSWQGREVAFLPRHGADHRFPPHRVNYRANVWAMRELGVTRLLAPCAVGSLKAELGPGAMVVLDQFVDRTTGRPDTLHDGAPVVHTSMAEPYCGTLRGLVTEELGALDLPHEPSGTIVVIQGPRFSTRAESRWFSAQGWDVVGMTQYPEVPLAREAGMCVAGIALVTDHDAGLEGHPDVAPVSHQQVLDVFAANIEHLKGLLARVVERIPAERDCDCGSSTG